MRELAPILEKAPAARPPFSPVPAVESVAAPLLTRGQGDRPALICFSHLRWSFVFQRPQQLMTRFARVMRVYFFEEPLPNDGDEARLDLHPAEAGVTVVVPRLPRGLDAAAQVEAQRGLLDRLCREEGIAAPVAWYYTPMSLAFSDHLRAQRVVYDCMDELAAFKGAPPELLEREAALLARADVVFTGGVSLYEAKRHRHARVHAFPSSVDVPHFAQARQPLADPPDQAAVGRPRIGHYAVIDERLDRELLAALVALRPDWQFILLGPVVKIDPAELPRSANLHYLGSKRYEELPAYLANWDVAFMPFALNEATRFISPTKTPEYLAAGKPVVSTPVRDVARTYGDIDPVRIAGTPAAFAEALEAALAQSRAPGTWLEEADTLLAGMSWDHTWARMREQLA